jgi:hypothetical protein
MAATQGDYLYAYQITNGISCTVVKQGAHGLHQEMPRV